MPAHHRVPDDRVDIGHGYNYQPIGPPSKPVQHSSTSRNDEWEPDDRSHPNRLHSYDDYRPRHEAVDVYERPSKPVSYQDYDYYGRRQDTSGPVRHYVSPIHTRHSAQSQEVGVRQRPRSPSPVEDDDDGEHMIIEERSKKATPKPAHYDQRTAVPKLRNKAQHLPGLYQTIFDVNHPQDASVHLELSITDDHETELEEFSRLQRLGNFGAAEGYFKDNLEPFLSNPYVFVQYGQMLLEKGDYLAFERLDPEAVFGTEDRSPSYQGDTLWRPRRPYRSRSRSWSRSREIRRKPRAHSRPQSPVEGGRRERRARFEPDVRIERRSSRSRSRSVDSIRGYNGRDRDSRSDRNLYPDGEPQLQDTRPESDVDELELLRQNWRLLKSICTIYSKGDYAHAFNEAWYAIQNCRFGTEIGSTEIQVVVLALHSCGYIERISSVQYYQSGLRLAAWKWIDWPILVKELLVQGRIWDFKDLYVAAVAAFSDEAGLVLFGTKDIKRLLIDDWVSEKDDESTNLALLDMLLEPAQPRTLFPNEAKRYVEAIIAHSPAAMRSRSFIRWILANAADAWADERKGEDDLWLAYEIHTHGFPRMVWHGKGCYLPGIYVPRNTENPGWIAPELSLGLNEPIQLALSLARELKDYKSQAACYKLLIFQSQDPTQLFQELAHLQKSVQGDKEGHLQTLLSSYLVCRHRPGKQKLLEELEHTDDWGDATMMRDELKYWARDVIERAVKKSLKYPTSTARLRNPTSFYMRKGLPWHAEQFPGQNTRRDHLPPIGTHSLDMHIRNYLRPTVQDHGQSKVRPYPGPSSPSGRQSSWPELRPQSPTSDDGLDGNRRQQEEKESMGESTDQLEEDLKIAEQRWRNYEEVVRIQIEEMEKRDAQIGRLQQELKREQERKYHEAGAQQDRENRERLEREDLTFRDHAERLRRAEDGKYQEKLTDETPGREAERLGKEVWSRGDASVVVMSKVSSDSYYSDSSSSRDDEDSSDDRSAAKATKELDESIRRDDEHEPEHEISTTSRMSSSFGPPRREQTKGKSNLHVEDGFETVQRDYCTDLALYERFQTIKPRDACLAGSPIPRSPTLPVSSPNVAAMSRGKEPESTQGPDPTLEEAQTLSQGQVEYLTAEPDEVEDRPDQSGSAPREDTGETLASGATSPRRTEDRDHDELRSKEQNERIANRPLRPVPTGRHWSPRPSFHESTGVWDAWEKSRRRKALRRGNIDASPSSPHIASTRPRPRQSSAQEPDGTQALERRTSWRDQRPIPSRGDRSEAGPSRRQSLLFDADGRPQRARTRSQNRHGYHDEAAGGSNVRARGSEVADGSHSVPEVRPTATGPGSRPQSTGDTAAGLHPTGPEPSVSEKPPADSWERGKDGFWRKRAVSTFHEAPEDGQELRTFQPQHQSKQGESSKAQDLSDPEQGISRKSTVTDPDPGEE